MPGSFSVLYRLDLSSLHPALEVPVTLRVSGQAKHLVFLVVTWEIPGSGVEVLMSSQTLISMSVRVTMSNVRA